MPRYGGRTGGIKRLQKKIARARGVPVNKTREMAVTRRGIKIRKGREKPGFKARLISADGGYGTGEPRTKRYQSVDKALTAMKRWDPKHGTFARKSSRGKPKKK